MKRIALLIAAAAAGLLLLASAFRPGREAAPVRPASRPSAAPSPAPVVEENVSTSVLIREAEQELLALCAERDRLLLLKKEPDPRTTREFADAQVDILKHLRQAEAYQWARLFEQALQELDSAERKIRRFPFESKPMTDLLPRITESREKTKAALAGTEARPDTGSADEHYRLAERLYQAGDLSLAGRECDEALRINPGHLAAKALLLQVRLITGSR
jgi:hypothetical protein